MKIRGLLSKERKWTQNCLARDKEGKALKNLDSYYIMQLDRNGKVYFQEFHNQDLAQSFSLCGALVRCYPLDDHEKIMDKLNNAVVKYTGKKLYVAQFNDDINTCFKDIQEILKIADV